MICSCFTKTEIIVWAAILGLWTIMCLFSGYRAGKKDLRKELKNDK